MTASAIYWVGQDYPPLEVFWRDEGGLTDFSDPGYTFGLALSQKGQPAVVNKFTGIFGYAGSAAPSATPNVKVFWSNELDGLVPGRFVMALTANFAGLPPNLFFGELILRAPGPAHGYCEIVDLLYNGDTEILLDQQVWIDTAADEMDARLGQLYDVPIDVNSPSVAPWVGLELKKINMLIATGRMQQSLAGGDRNTLAYGASLIKEGQDCLNVLIQQSLDGVKRADGSFLVTAPAGSNPDARSGVTAFERFAMERRHRETWSPGPRRFHRPF